MMEACALECAGFETKAFYIGDERRGFTLHGRVEMPPYENDCVCCVRVEEKKSVPVLPVFDVNGVKILEESGKSGSPFILMDEIGRLESRAEGFCRAVLACLDKEKRVIGVLQQCDSDLVKTISARTDVTVIEVTQENRDALLAELIDAYRRYSSGTEE